MNKKTIKGAWQKRVYKALLKRRLRQGGDAAAKTAAEQTPPQTDEREE